MGFAFAFRTIALCISIPRNCKMFGGRGSLFQSFLRRCPRPPISDTRNSEPLSKYTAFGTPHLSIPCRSAKSVLSPEGAYVRFQPIIAPDFASRNAVRYSEQITAVLSCGEKKKKIKKENLDHKRKNGKKKKKKKNAHSSLLTRNPALMGWNYRRARTMPATARS